MGPQHAVPPDQRPHRRQVHPPAARSCCSPPPGGRPASSGPTARLRPRRRPLRAMRLQRRLPSASWLVPRDLCGTGRAEIPVGPEQLAVSAKTADPTERNQLFPPHCADGHGRRRLRAKDQPPNPARGADPRAPAEHDRRAPQRVRGRRRPRLHDGTIIPEQPNLRWGTDATMALTRVDGWVWVFACVDHYTAEAWAHVPKIGDRFAALQPGLGMG
jgi:hypothetical protein